MPADAIQRSNHERNKLTLAERSLRARAAAYRLHSLYDSRQLTANARAAFQDRFARQVDPDGIIVRGGTPASGRVRPQGLLHRLGRQVRPSPPPTGHQGLTQLSPQSRSPSAIRRPVSCARAIAADLPYRCTMAAVVQPPSAIRSPSDAPARFSSCAHE